MHIGNIEYCLIHCFAHLYYHLFVVALMEPPNVRDDYTSQYSPREMRLKIDTAVDASTMVLGEIAGIRKELQDIRSILTNQHELMSQLTDQLTLLVSQFSRTETKKIEELNNMTKAIATLKSTVHAELSECKVAINKELKCYLAAIDNDRETVSFEL